MADRYWVGNSGNWSDTNRWSETSGGSGGATVPTAADNVYFDALSFDASSTVTLNVSASCNNFDWTGIDASVRFTSTSQPIHIHGDVSLNVNLTWNFSGSSVVNFSATNAIDIRTNGVRITTPSVDFNGTGGEFINKDSFIVIGSVFLRTGTWNTNSQDVSISGTVRGQSPNTGTLTLGNTNFNCSNFFIYSFAPFTLNASTSTITITSVGSGGSQGFICQVSRTFYNINCGALMVEAACTFENLALRSTASSFATGAIAANIIVNNNFIIEGFNYSTRRTLIVGRLTGNQRTITCNGSVIASSADFRDIKGAGSASWDLSAISGGSGDGGGNSDITFTSPLTLYYVHTSGTCNYSDNKWSLESGGTIGQRVPLIQDTVIFDNNSFTGTSAISMNVYGIGSLDMSLVDKNVDISFWTTPLLFYGNVLIPPNITTNSYNYIRSASFHGLGNCTLSIANPVRFSIEAFRGNYSLGSNLITDDIIPGWNICNLDLNNYDISVNRLDFRGSTVNFGSGTITITPVTSASSWIYLGSLNFGTSTIIIAPASNVINHEILLDNTIFNNIKIQGNNTGMVIFNFATTGTNTSFNTLEIAPGKRVAFMSRSGTSRVFNINNLIALGTSDASITLISGTTGSLAFINASTGSTRDNIQVDYCFIRDLSVGPIDTWYAGINSVDLGNNSGWNFYDYYKRFWVGGSGNWGDTSSWSYRPGGEPSAILPNRDVDVFFDASSFSVPLQTSTVNIDSSCRTLDMSAVDVSAFLDIVYATNRRLYCHGNVILNEKARITSGANSLELLGANNTVDFYGSGPWQLVIRGNYTALSDISTAYQTNIASSGQFNLNNQNLTTSILSVTGTMYAGDGNINIILKSNTLGLFVPSYANWQSQNSTINFMPDSGSARIEAWLGGKTYNIMKFLGNHTGFFEIQGGNHTFNTLEIAPGRKLRFTVGSSHTITNKFIALGTSDASITLITTTDGSIASLNASVGVPKENIEVDYCFIRDLSVGPADIWYAGTNSVDLGNNTGWVFSILPPSISQIYPLKFMGQPLRYLNNMLK